MGFGTEEWCRMEKGKDNEPFPSEINRAKGEEEEYHAPFPEK